MFMSCHHTAKNAPTLNFIVPLELIIMIVFSLEQWQISRRMWEVLNFSFGMDNWEKKEMVDGQFRTAVGQVD